MARPPYSLSLSLSLDNASILQRLKEGYLIWMGIVPHIPKVARYTTAARIENKFLDLLELTHTTYFSEREKKSQKLSECILTLDTLKFLITVAWEAKFISHKQYEETAIRLDEVGKMLGGWRKSLVEKNTKNPAVAGKR